MATIKRITEETKSKYVNMLITLGEEGVYRRAIGLGLMQFGIQVDPDLEIMDLSDAFFVMYRRTGDDDFYTIARALRRAAHVVYRELRRQDKEKKPNFQRFLNVI